MGLPASTGDDPDATIPYVDEEPLLSNWVASYDVTELRSLELEDPNLQPLVGWLESNSEPSDSDLRLHSPATRALWLCRPCLEVLDGVLYYRWMSHADRCLCLVVPDSLKEEVLHYCHDSKVSGHVGQKKTIERVRQSFMWYSMTVNVEIGTS